MFTVGLFTTHTPYIAFVFFYAFFFLFGYQKISDEKLPAKNKSNVHALVFCSDNQFSSLKADFDFNESCGTFSLEKTSKVFRDRKAELLIPPEKTIQQTDFEFSNFSRPPPAA